MVGRGSVGRVGRVIIVLRESRRVRKRVSRSVTMIVVACGGCFSIIVRKGRGCGSCCFSWLFPPRTIMRKRSESR